MLPSCFVSHDAATPALIGKQIFFSVLLFRRTPGTPAFLLVFPFVPLTVSQDGAFGTVAKAASRVVASLSLLISSDTHVLPMAVHAFVHVLFFLFAVRIHSPDDGGGLDGGGLGASIVNTVSSAEPKLPPVLTVLPSTVSVYEPVPNWQHMPSP